MNKITYRKGDATTPVGEGPGIIVHICNDIGVWGMGFVMALSRKWKEPEKQYRQWYRNGKDFKTGNVQFVKVEEGLHVANLIGQEGIREKEGIPPVRYDAVETGLSKVADKAKESGSEIHMPRIGCGLAGGKWEEIEKIINKTLVERGIPVTVYDLE